MHVTMFFKCLRIVLSHQCVRASNDASVGYTLSQWNVHRNSSKVTSFGRLVLASGMFVSCKSFQTAHKTDGSFPKSARKRPRLFARRNPFSRVRSWPSKRSPRCIMSSADSNLILPELCQIGKVPDCQHNQHSQQNRLNGDLPAIDVVLRRPIFLTKNVLSENVKHNIRRSNNCGQSHLRKSEKNEKRQ